jgi:hypothetical protein
MNRVIMSAVAPHFAAVGFGGTAAAEARSVRSGERASPVAGT